jgi:ectoine hydroxylase-related dioxygenase (phytanoyl-CoA dioxygenase family)
MAGKLVPSLAWRDRFDRDGFAIIDRVLTAGQVSELIAVTHALSSTEERGVLHRGGEVYGARDLIWRIPAIRRLARSKTVVSIARAILGPDAFVVRGLYFDKTLSTNWNLPWHQDMTIAVQARREAAGFGPWTLKAGIPHVHAPADLLARMLAIRLHLDDCGAASGPLRVLPGSHTAGKLSAAAVAAWSARAGELSVECLVPAGGAVLMRPLLLHASSSGTAPGHRRVIHLEFAAESLPDGLHWYDPASQIPLAAPEP